MQLPVCGSHGNYYNAGCSVVCGYSVYQFFLPPPPPPIKTTIIHCTFVLKLLYESILFIWMDKSNGGMPTSVYLLLHVCTYNMHKQYLCIFKSSPSESMVYRGPGFLAVVWFGSSPTLPPALSVSKLDQWNTGSLLKISVSPMWKPDRWGCRHVLACAFCRVGALRY